MASTMSVRRHKAGSSAIAFFAAHGEEIGSGVDERLIPFYQDGETPVDFRLALTVVNRLMQASLDGVIDTDKANVDEKDNDIAPTLELEKAGREVNSQLVFIRRMLTGFYGVDLANQILATDGPAASPAQPHLLWRQGEQTVERLRTTPFQEPERTSSSFEFDPLALANELEPAVARLQAAMDAVTLERRKIETTVKEKAATQAAFDADFRDCLRFGVGVCRLAKEPALARKLKASALDSPRRRSASPDEDSPEEGTEDSAPPEDDPSPTGEDESGDESSETS